MQDPRREGVRRIHKRQRPLSRPRAGSVHSSPRQSSSSSPAAAPPRRRSRRRAPLIETIRTGGEGLLSRAGVASASMTLPFRDSGSAPASGAYLRAHPGCDGLYRSGRQDGSPSAVLISRGTRPGLEAFLGPGHLLGNRRGYVYVQVDRRDRFPIEPVDDFGDRPRLALLGHHQQFLGDAEQALRIFAQRSVERLPEFFSLAGVRVLFRGAPLPAIAIPSLKLIQFPTFCPLGVYARLPQLWVMHIHNRHAQVFSASPR